MGEAAADNAALVEEDIAHDLAAAARRAVCHVIKARARRYERRPAMLEALHPGLSIAEPATLVAIAEHIVERERGSPRRWFGFGGEVSLVNAQAALLVGRTRRRRQSPRPGRASGLPNGDAVSQA